MSRRESIGGKEKQKVRVIGRIRPQNQKELRLGGEECVTKLESPCITIYDGTQQVPFTLDAVFGAQSTQEEVFLDAAEPLIEDVMKGYNATIFAYGQTSSGKTHTMEGPDIYNEKLRGIIPRAVEGIFNGVANADPSIEFSLKVTYIEIYMEKIRDLLDVNRVKNNLNIREDKVNGIHVSGVTEEYVASQQELLGLMARGANNRATAATGMNEGSSRSHSVFSITVYQRDTTNNVKKTGKLILIDLAGSEMVKKTNATGQQLDEAKTINRSLSALGQVINALTDSSATHVPYRDSKLTRVLQDSLGGNSKTVLIVACSPAAYNTSETISTLRFGARAKNIENKAKVNATKSTEELEQLLAKAEATIAKQKTEIASLQSQLYAVIGVPRGEDNNCSDSFGAGIAPTATVTAAVITATPDINPTPIAASSGVSSNPSSDAINNNSTVTVGNNVRVGERTPSPDTEATETGTWNEAMSPMIERGGLPSNPTPIDISTTLPPPGSTSVTTTVPVGVSASTGTASAPGSPSKAESAANAANIVLISSLNDQVKELQEQVSILTQNLEDESGESVRKEEENSALNALVVQFTAEKDALISELAQLKTSSGDKESELNKIYAATIEDFKIDKAAWEEARIEFESNISRLRFDFCELESTYETAKSENIRLKEEISEMSGDQLEPEPEVVPTAEVEVESELVKPEDMSKPEIMVAATGTFTGPGPCSCCGSSAGAGAGAGAAASEELGGGSNHSSQVAASVATAVASGGGTRNEEADDNEEDSTWHSTLPPTPPPSEAMSGLATAAASSETETAAAVNAAVNAGSQDKVAPAAPVITSESGEVIPNPKPDATPVPVTTPAAAAAAAAPPPLPDVDPFGATVVPVGGIRYLNLHAFKQRAAIRLEEAQGLIDAFRRAATSVSSAATSSTDNGAVAAISGGAGMEPSLEAFNKSITAWHAGQCADSDQFIAAVEHNVADYNRHINKLTRKIMDLESQRSKLSADLKETIERTIILTRDLEDMSGWNPELQRDFCESKTLSKSMSLQQRLEQLVAVHRQLLRRFGSLELENKEIRKKLQLRDDRIRNLEVSNKEHLSSTRKQIETYAASMKTMRQGVETLKAEYYKLYSQQENLLKSAAYTANSNKNGVYLSGGAGGGVGVGAGASGHSGHGHALLSGGGGSGKLSGGGGSGSGSGARTLRGQGGTGTDSSHNTHGSALMGGGGGSGKIIRPNGNMPQMQQPVVVGGGGSIAPAIDPSRVYTDRTGTGTGTGTTTDTAGGGSGVVRRPSPSIGSVSSSNGGSASLTTASNTSGPTGTHLSSHTSAPQTHTPVSANVGAYGVTAPTAGAERKASPSGSADPSSNTDVNSSAEKRNSLGSWSKFLGMNPGGI